MSRYKQYQENENETFICRSCGMTVAPPEAGGSHRNHCPRCLWSLHVDLRTGDRRCACRAPMEPISVWVRPGGEWALLHRCVQCGQIRSNRIAGDDNEALLLNLAARPLSRLPFPAENLYAGSNAGLISSNADHGENNG